MNLETIISHFGVKNNPPEMDLEIIIENYWEKFKTIFPNVLKEEFIKWINEDYYGGWEDYVNYNVGGRRELKMLYATIRAKKPKKILEIGTYMGDSTNHILLAAENNKKEGYDCEVTTIDITDYVGNKKLHDYPLNQPCPWCGCIPELVINKSMKEAFSLEYRRKFSCVCVSI
jgi:hypothetical protein